MCTAPVGRTGVYLGWYRVGTTGVVLPGYLASPQENPPIARESLALDGRVTGLASVRASWRLLPNAGNFPAAAGFQGSGPPRANSFPESRQF